MLKKILLALVVKIVFESSFMLAASQADLHKLESDTTLNMLRSSNFLVGIFESAAFSGIESKCVYDMQDVLSGIVDRKLWALKLIDSFGNVPSSFSWGDNFWFSPNYECSAISDPVKPKLDARYNRTVQDEFFTTKSPFPVEFRVIYANYSTPNQLDIKLQHLQILHIGVCVPSSCSNKELLYFSETYFQKRILQRQALLQVDMEMMGVKVPQFDVFDLLKQPNIMILITIAVGLFCLAALAALSELIYQRNVFVADESSEKKMMATSEFEQTSFGRFISCFNSLKNFKTLFNADEIYSPSYVSALPGIRTIICFWIIFLHVNWYPMFTYKNILHMALSFDKLIAQPTYQGFYYVDAFFVVSGLLLTYNFLGNRRRLESIRQNNLWQNMKLYCQLLGHRYLRLVPVAMLAVLLSDIVYDYLDKSSPYFMNASNDLYCKKNWVANMFLLNNIYSMKGSCASWEWYLACDMQFFIMFLAILFVYAKYERLAKYIYWILCILFMSISFYCYYRLNFTFGYDVHYNTEEFVYNKPWTRINPYFGGVLMGYVLHRISAKEWNIPPPLALLFWIVAFGIYLLTISMTYFKATPSWAASGIVTIGKFFFGIFIGSMIIVCQKGYGGMFAELLNSKVMVHCGKLTFTMYMTASIWITLFYALKRYGNHFDEVETVLGGYGIWFHTYFYSLIIATFVEVPFTKLSDRYVLRRNR